MRYLFSMFCASLLTLGIAGADDFPPLPASLADDAVAAAPTTPAIPPLPGRFDAKGVLHNPAETAYKLQISAFTAYFLVEKRTAVGLGFGYGDPHRTRLELQISPDTAGLGLSRVIVPGPDLAAGIGYHYDFAAHAWLPAAYLAVARW